MSIAHLYDPCEPKCWMFDCGAARHWWLTDHHEGQWSETYRQLCSSQYNPALTEVSPASENADDLDERYAEVEMYNHYCDRAGCEHERIGVNVYLEGER